MLKFEAVIFDIDGTLLDSVDSHAEAWQRAFQTFGFQFELAKIRSQIGKGGDQLLPEFLPEHDVKSIGPDIEKTRGNIFKAEFLPRVKPFPRVRELFERMKRDGLKIALASSAKKDELNHYARLAKIEDLIDAGTSSDDAEKSKPHPDIFAAALTKLGDISAGRCITIGDTPYDAEAAARIGIRTIGLLCGGFAEDDLRRSGAIAIYQDPSDLLERYDASPLAR